MASHKNLFGDRGNGGGREPGRRGLPQDEGNGEENRVLSAAVPAPAPAPAPATTPPPPPPPPPPATPTPSPPPPPPTPAPATAGGFSPPPPLSRFARASSIASSILPIRASPTPGPPSSHHSVALPPWQRQVRPGDMRGVEQNQMKLERLASFGYLRVGDEIELVIGDQTIRARITALPAARRIFLSVLQPGNAAPELITNAQKGKTWFENPKEIVGALAGSMGVNFTGNQYWTSLVQYRGGGRLGTLMARREELRQLGLPAEQQQQQQQQPQPQQQQQQQAEEPDRAESPNQAMKRGRDNTSDSDVGEGPSTKRQRGNAPMALSDEGFLETMAAWVGPQQQQPPQQQQQQEEEGEMSDDGLLGGKGKGRAE